jgi:hypothetical protein
LSVEGRGLFGPVFIPARVIPIIGIALSPTTENVTMSLTALIGTVSVSEFIGTGVAGFAIGFALVSISWIVASITLRPRPQSRQLSQCLDEAQVHRSLVSAQSARAARFKGYAEEAWKRG